MPRTTTFIAVVAAALAVAVPTAAAEGQPTGTHTAEAANGVDARSDGLNRLYGLGEYANPIDRRERALVEKSQTKPEQQVVSGFDAWSDGLNRMYGLGEHAPAGVGDDRFRVGPASAPVLVTPSPGTDGEWPQIGIGLGVGIVLALGLVLAMKATRQRPLAH